MKVMGIDYGRARIGIALSDSLGLMASPLCVIHEKHFPTQVKKTVALIHEHEPQKIIIGLPKNLNGSDSESVLIAKEFKEKISENIMAEIEFRDERLTTKLANSMLNDSGIKGSGKRKEKIDAAAAVIILQAYLDENKKK